MSLVGTQFLNAVFEGVEGFQAGVGGKNALGWDTQRPRGQEVQVQEENNPVRSGWPRNEISGPNTSEMRKTKTM